MAATIGAFDGLHLGHRELISRILGREDFASAVLTFAGNPKRILSPSSFRGELTSLGQRLELIDSMGVDLCVLIDFSGDFSKLPGRQFLSMLCANGNLRFLAVGSDFRCGHRLDTDAEGVRLFCAGFSVEVELLKAVLWEGHPVSSSRIRKAILEGRVEEAALMLGRPYELDLRGGAFEAAGMIRPPEGQAAPPPGAYEAAVSYDNGESLPAIAALEPDGLWSFDSLLDRAPNRLRLLRKVSRD
jgi:riboflavin kinase/FMN adenylyltransferase